jgi:hypothetical protein
MVRIPRWDQRTRVVSLTGMEGAAVLEVDGNYEPGLIHVASWKKVVVWREFGIQEGRKAQ